jgi:tetratricopeptide (TPR) repeat protein
VNWLSLNRPPLSTSFVFLLLAVVLFPPMAPPASAQGQSAMACHAVGPGDTVDETPPDKYPPPQKMTGIGNVHLKVTATAEAQMWFDQGLNLLHDFWDYEAIRAFEQGVRVDAQCAMCYWGIYQAESFRHSAGKTFAEQALDKAVSLKGHASKTERLYIEASAAHEAEAKDKKDGDNDAGDSEEVQILRKLVKRSGQDTQARIFLAEALMDGYDDDGDPKKGQKEGIAVLQGVLKDEPDNSAANHYWIHAVEASKKPEQALHSAEILGNLAPTSGHMVHMPGHIFFRVGDYARAQQSFAASTEADERYMQEQHVGVDDDWNYLHNLMYAIANVMEEGRLADATQLSAKLRGAHGKLEASLYPWSPRDGMTRLDPQLPVALRTADWTRVLQLLRSSQVPPELPNLLFLSRQLTDFATGMQALETHHLAQAEESSRRLDAEMWRTSQRVKSEEASNDKEKKKDEKDTKMKVMPDAWPKPLVANLSIMSLELRAGILLQKKQTDEAKNLFSQAAQQEKDLGYHEPPAYVRPVRETEANLLLQASAWTDAKEAYQQALVERPKSGFPLYGIALSSEQAGDAKAAAAAYTDFVAAWTNADTDLPQLAHARTYLTQHGSAAVAGAGEN